MGWLCAKCGSENDFSLRNCEVCNMKIDEHSFSKYFREHVTEKNNIKISDALLSVNRVFKIIRIFCIVFLAAVSPFLLYLLMFNMDSKIAFENNVKAGGGNIIENCKTWIGVCVNSLNVFAFNFKTIFTQFSSIFGNLFENIRLLFVHNEITLMYTNLTVLFTIVLQRISIFVTNASIIKTSAGLAAATVFSNTSSSMETFLSFIKGKT